MEILSFFDQFYRLSSAAKEELRQIIREQSYDKNALVQAIGSRCKTIYFVKEGLARIFYYKNGQDLREHFALENEMIVRAESLFTGQATQKLQLEVLAFIAIATSFSIVQSTTRKRCFSLIL